MIGAGIAALALASSAGLGAAEPAAAAGSCDVVAAPNGSNANPGTQSAPLRTAQGLVSALRSGETGCLRGGRYGSEDEVKFSTARVTLKSFPGERALVAGRLYVPKQADGVTISGLDLDGRNRRDLPSPTINADHVVVRGNDITNFHTEICVMLGSPDWGRAHNTLIVDNDIHDCGELPATNMDHGIYVNSSDDAVIRDNRIYDNADRGIQIYPDSQGTLVTGNVIDRNGQGVIFGGGSASASSNNVVAHNVITNSKIRDNIDSYWAGPVGNGNVAHDNCVGGGAYDNGDGGIKSGSRLGFRAYGNLIRVPSFAAPGIGNFAIPAANPCARVLEGGSPKAGGGSRESAAVTIDPARKRVRAMKSVRIRGRAPGASVIRILVRRDGDWRRLDSDRTGRGGSYRASIRLRHPGRNTVKAVAGGLRDSRAVKLRVKKRRR